MARPLDYGKQFLADTLDPSITVVLDDVQANYDVVQSVNEQEFTIRPQQFTPEQNLQPPQARIKDSVAGIVVNVDDVNNNEITILTNDRRSEVVSLAEYTDSMNIAIGQAIAVHQPRKNGPWLAVGDTGSQRHEFVGFNIDLVADSNKISYTLKEEAYSSVDDANEWDKFWTQQGDVITINKTGWYDIRCVFELLQDGITTDPFVLVDLQIVVNQEGTPSSPAGHIYNVLDARTGDLIAPNVAPIHHPSDVGPIIAATKGFWVRQQLFAFERLRGDEC